jgi:DNA-binding NtrC family response regulator
VHLPVAETPATVKATHSTLRLRPGLRVLLVEDHSAVRHALGQALQRFGCSVSSAESPARALELIEPDRGFQILVTDVSMPGASGPELAAIAVELIPTLRVLFMSANPAGDDVTQWLGRKGARFLQKPIALELLRQTVAELDDGRHTAGTDATP